MSMKFERDERKFDFHDIGCEIKRKRETSGMTQDQLAFIIDRDPRTIIYNENDGQHPSLNTFYQMVTMFDISVDQFFYPDIFHNGQSVFNADGITQPANSLTAPYSDTFFAHRLLQLARQPETPLVLHRLLPKRHRFYKHRDTDPED